MGDDITTEDISNYLRLEKRISSLEKKLGEVENYYENSLTEHERHIAENLLEPQLAELRDALQKSGMKWDFRLDEQGGFINDLKEDIKGALDYTTRWAKNLENVEGQFGIGKALQQSIALETRKIREVLREFITYAKGYYKFDRPKFYEKCNKLLEKLDVGKTEGHMKRGTKDLSMKELVESLETEKKASKWEISNAQRLSELEENCKMCKDCNLYPFRDSGGEPIMRPICLQCSTQPLLLQGCDNDNRWYCPECDYEWYKEERLPGGTGVVVKREKIEFWRKELLNKTDEVLKSMREVLGIE